MRFRVLLTPEQAKQSGPLSLEVLGPRHLGMTGETEGNHQLWVVVPRLPVVDCNRPLPSLQRGTARNGTPIAVASQYRFPLPTKVFFILPFQRVASRTAAQSENLIVSTWAAYRTLYEACL